MRREPLAHCSHLWAGKIYTTASGVGDRPLQAYKAMPHLSSGGIGTQELLGYILNTC